MKWLQSYWPSNFENDSTLGQLEPGPNAIALNSGGMAEVADLSPTNPKFSALKDLILFSTESKAQEASSILKVGFALSK